MKSFIHKWLDDFCKMYPMQPDLEKLFRSCFLNTFDTTVKFEPDGETYVFTGDIPAMWLRDSSAQVLPYLELAKSSPEVRDFFCGLLRRQFRYILIDPYANAFNEEENGHGHKDITKQRDWVWERKFEIDSLCYPLWLACRYYNMTGDRTPLDERFVRAARLAIETFTVEQRHDELSDYSFIRTGEYAHDTLPNGGKGDPVPYTGMIWSAFRPSDDRCKYNYFIPGNMFAAATLKDLAALKAGILPEEVTRRAAALAAEIDAAVQKYAVIDHPTFGKIYAYEVDGRGNYLLMDDANMPGLMSIPCFGYRTAADPVYQNTRRFVLSRENPFYREGKFASGVGSPHTPDGTIWHLGILLCGLTSTSDDEKLALLEVLRSTHAGTYYMHESFDKDDPTVYTRPWFAWANSFFALFVIENRDLFSHAAAPLKAAG